VVHHFPPRFDEEGGLIQGALEVEVQLLAGEVVVFGIHSAKQ